MDRAIIYPGAIPLSDDILKSNQFAMVGLGRLAQAALGTGTTIVGMACTPPAAPALTATVAAGEIYSVQPLEATPYSSLPANTTDTVVKQGRTTGATFSTPAPTTAGTTINYLVQASYSDSDTGSLVLPYYNAANPQQAYSGPNNTGTAQPTTRAGACVLSVKAGVAATTGAQATPAPDAGAVGVWVIKVPYGATTVTSAMISAYSGTRIIGSSGLLPTSLLATNGYRIHPDGYVEQWGVLTVSVTGTAPYGSFSWPTPFPVGNVFAPTGNCTNLADGSSLDNAVRLPVVGFDSLTKNGARWRLDAAGAAFSGSVNIAYRVNGY